MFMIAKCKCIQRDKRISHCSTHKKPILCSFIFSVVENFARLMLIIQSHDYTLLLPLECSHITEGLVLVPKNVCVLLGRFFFLFGGGGGSQLVIYDTDSYCKHESA